MKQGPVPSREDLLSAYENLQFSHQARASDLTQWSQWARLDARLAELIVIYLSENFEVINPYSLWKDNVSSELPQALAVLIEFAGLRFETPEKKRPFDIWKKAVLNGLKPASPQLFFIPSGAPDPSRCRQEMAENLRPFSKWGFYSNEWIARIKSTKRGRTEKNRTLLSVQARRSILERCAATSSRLTVDVYMKACEGRIHRRTAERDLLACDFIKARGATRARVYLRKYPVEKPISRFPGSP